MKIADLGWREACRRDASLALGLNAHAGQVTYPAVGEALDLPVVPSARVLA